MHKRIDITGQKHNRLLVLSFSHVDKWGNSVWRCRCDCGKETLAQKHKITNGHVISCGCYRDEMKFLATYKHGGTVKKILSTEYKRWAGMKERCKAYSKDKKHIYYDRGITVCERWEKSFHNFLADMGPCPEGYTIERLNNDKGYQPDNCKWATIQEQNNNKQKSARITFNGQTKTIAQWAVFLRVAHWNIRMRLRAGWSVEKALTEPVEYRKPHNQWNF